MDLKVENTPMDGLVILTPRKIRDSRGFFSEVYNKEKMIDCGIDVNFHQDNQSESAKAVLRGLHAQLRKPQAKLVRVVVGEIYDVAVDARPESSSFGKWHGDYLSAENMKQLFIPEGFLHGFCVTSEMAIVSYKCSALYEPADQFGVLWNDRELGIDWPVQNPVLSEKDSKNMTWPEFKNLLLVSGTEKGVGG